MPKTVEASPELAAQVGEEVMKFPRYKPGDPNWGERPYVAEFARGGTNVYTDQSNCWRPDLDWSAAGEVLQSKPILESADEFAVALMAGLNVPRDRQAYEAVSDVLSRLSPLSICLAALEAVGK